MTKKINDISSYEKLNLKLKDLNIKIEKINEIAEKTNIFLEDKVDLDKKRLSKAIKKTESKLINLFSKFKTGDGKLVQDKVNIAIVQKIHSDLQGIFKDLYEEETIRSVNGYNKVAKQIKENFSGMEKITTFSGIDKTMIQSLKDQALNQYEVFGQQAQQKIANAMYDSVLSGSSFSTLVSTVSGVLTGSLSKHGFPMENYARLWASDGVMNFYQNVTNKKAEDANIDSFLYYGNIINTTRDFCKKRVGKVYTKKEINSWNDMKWQGKSGAPLANRGGYNCRHHWQPVNKDWFDEKEDIEKQIGLIPVKKKVIVKKVEKVIPEKVLKVKSDRYTKIIPYSKPKKYNNKVEHELKEFELRVKANNFETGRIIDSKTGKVLTEKIGSKSSITWTTEEQVLSKGNILSHNHPTGRSFSPSDITFGIARQAKEVRACTKNNGIYKMQFKNTDTLNLSEFVFDYNKQEIKTKKYWQEKINKSKTIEEQTKTINIANKAHHDKIWQSLCNSEKYKGKLIYSRQEMWTDKVKETVSEIVDKKKVLKSIENSLDEGTVLVGKKQTSLLNKPPGKKDYFKEAKVKYIVEPSDYSLPVKIYKDENFDKKILVQGEKLFGKASKIYSKKEQITIIKSRFKKAGITITDKKADEYLTALNLYSKNADGISFVTSYNHAIDSGTIDSWRKKTIQSLKKDHGHEINIAEKITMQIESVSKLLNEYIEETIDFDRKQTLFRGLSVDDNLNKWEVGEKIKLKSISSWSTSKKHSQDFASKIAKETEGKLGVFVLKSGKHIRSSSVTEFSEWMEEKEILLGRNVEFKLTNKVIKDDRIEFHVEAVPKETYKDLKKRSDLDPAKDYYRLNGIWYKQGIEVSKEIAEEFSKRAIPPGWNNVFATLENTKVLACGQDKVGKWQARYNKDFMKQGEEKKFKRVKLFSRDMSTIMKSVEDHVLRGEDKAMLLRLEHKTAIRIGSKITYKTKKKAYGLTTFLPEHVNVQGNKIFLDFVAKKGVTAHYEIVDDVLAEWMLKKKKMAIKAGTEMFPDISNTSLNSYLRKLSNNKEYSIKDFRTYHATMMAYKELRKHKGKILSLEVKKNIIDRICIDVSDFLHNTPVMARDSYIDPIVWDLIGGLEK